MHSDFIYVERVRVYLKINAIQYLQSTCYVPGPGLYGIHTISNSQDEFYFAYVGLRLRREESSHPGSQSKSGAESRVSPGDAISQPVHSVLPPRATLAGESLKRAGVYGR